MGAFLYYLALPLMNSMQDHAGGALLVSEAGGTVSDSRGKPLDFGLGRTLGENFGVVASGQGVHSAVLEAVQKARSEEAQKL